MLSNPSLGASDKTVILDEAPRTIQKAIKEHAGSGKIMRIEKATEQRQVQYEALIKRAPSGREIEFIFNSDGGLDSTEEPLSIQELPGTVQRASETVVGNENISTAERRIKGGTITGRFPVSSSPTRASIFFLPTYHTSSSDCGARTRLGVSRKHFGIGLALTQTICGRLGIQIAASLEEESGVSEVR
jgi:hypothetical protein